jgi:transposase
LARCKKNARRRKALIVFEDESGISLNPSVRRTWAPRGKTPVVRAHLNWKRLSMAAAIAYRPGGAARVVFSSCPGSYDTEALIEFISELHAELGEVKVTLIWDGLTSHRSKKMRAFLAQQRRWLVTERLPAYAPELNPVEALWGNLKATELANLFVDTIGELDLAAEKGIARVCEESHPAWSFLRHTGLLL